MQGIYWLAEDLQALQEALCSVDFAVRLVCVTSLNITDCQGHEQIQSWSGTMFEWKFCWNIWIILQHSSVSYVSYFMRKARLMISPYSCVGPLPSPLPSLLPPLHSIWTNGQFFINTLLLLHSLSVTAHMVLMSYTGRLTTLLQGKL